nr:MBL fold metallo-hydrolase [Candidatus Sigynarchaeota archaeon]
MLEKVIGKYGEANTYVISDHGEAIIIDPQSDYEQILWKVKKYAVKGIVATHGHSDHIGGIAELAVELQVPVMVSPAEQSFLTPLDQSKLPFLLKPIREGDVIQVGMQQWQVIDTPGHSPGGISLYSKEEKILICGDALFQGSIGRTDIHGSNWEVLRQTLREKIFTLPAETTAYPGHGPETTLEKELTENPYMDWIFEKRTPN